MVAGEFEAEVQSEAMAAELKGAYTAANLAQTMTSMQLLSRYAVPHLPRALLQQLQLEFHPFCWGFAVH